MGLVWGLIAAAGYASMNLCLRAVVELDPFVSSLVRTIPMLLLAWAMLGLELWKPTASPSGQRLAVGGQPERPDLVPRSSHPVPRQPARSPQPPPPCAGAGAASGARGAVVQGGAPACGRWPGWVILWPLLAVGVAQAVVGNGGFQIGLAVSGLTVTAPATSAATIWGTALGAWWLLREGLSGRAIVGLLVLVVSLPLLTSGGGGGSGPAWLGALAGAAAGLSYGAGNIVMRRASQAQGLSLGLTMVPVSTMGFFGLLAAVLTRGADALTPLDVPTVSWLLFAGVFNAVAFLSLTKALTLLPASRVGALGSLQTAISAVGGVVFFAEPWTAAVAAGLALSVVGATLAQQARRPARAPAVQPQSGLLR